MSVRARSASARIGTGRPPRGARSRSSLARLALTALLAASAAGAAAAQVLEIGEDGQVTVHDGPAIYSAAGATPILPDRPRIGRAPLAVARTPALREAAVAARLSPSLIAAVAWRESGFRAGVVSSAGAIGEMQLMPSTARSLGVDPYDTRQNFRGGAVYLGVLLRHYDGDLVRALAAYNAGPGAVDRWGGVPPYKETRAYVAAVLDRMSQSVSPSVDDYAAR